MRQHYFHLKIVGPGKDFYEGTEENGQKYIIAMHPHTIFAVSLTFFFALKKRFAKYKPVGTSLLFYIPFVREFVELAGTIKANRACMLRELRSPDCQGLLLCPGGMREVNMEGDEIKKRMGFLEIAATTKTWVVPVWSNKERSFYRIICPLGNFFLNTPLMYPWPVIALGWRWILCLPQPMEEEDPCTVAVGTPFLPTIDTLAKDQKHFYEEIEKLKKMC